MRAYEIDPDIIKFAASMMGRAGFHHNKRIFYATLYSCFFYIGFDNGHASAGAGSKLWAR